MDEPTAFLYQARADREAAERFAADEVGAGRCHAIAKWQQTVEKAVKAMVYSLKDAGVLGADVRAKHDVYRYVDILLRLPHARKHRELQQVLHGLLDQKTRAGIKALDGLVPHPAPTRNTEYPFQDVQGQWTYPAAEGVFSQDEVRRFRALAHRVLEGAGRIVSSLRRRPRERRTDLPG